MVVAEEEGKGQGKGKDKAWRKQERDGIRAIDQRNLINSASRRLSTLGIGSGGKVFREGSDGEGK